MLAMAERAMGICDALAACVADRRDAARTTHSVADILKARVLAIPCGYEDALLMVMRETQGREASPSAGVIEPLRRIGRWSIEIIK